VEQLVAPLLELAEDVADDEALVDEVLDDEVLDDEVLDDEALDDEVPDDEVLDDELEAAPDPPPPVLPVTDPPMPPPLPEGPVAGDPPVPKSPSVPVAQPEATAMAARGPARKSSMARCMAEQSRAGARAPSTPAIAPHCPDACRALSLHLSVQERIVGATLRA
jgi:hypothetical protein